MDSVRLQRLIDVCDTKENTAIYLLEEWNYEPQVIFLWHCKTEAIYPTDFDHGLLIYPSNLDKGFFHLRKTVFCLRGEARDDYFKASY